MPLRMAVLNAHKAEIVSKLTPDDQLLLESVHSSLSEKAEGSEHGKISIVNSTIVAWERD